MNHRVISPQGVDLASRRSASQLRQDVEKELIAGHKVIFDLSNIESISESYADELFGILTLTRGVEVFGTLVAVRGAKPNVMQSLARAIKERLDAEEEGALRGTLQTLVAAKHAKEARTPRAGL